MTQNYCPSDGDRTQLVVAAFGPWVKTLSWEGSPSSEVRGGRKEIKGTVIKGKGEG